MALSAAVMAVVFRIAEIPWNIIAETITVLASARVLHQLTRGPKPVLTSFFVRKKLNRVIGEEIRVMIGFSAACFLLDWPLGRGPVAIFIGFNFATQLIWLYVASQLRTFLRGRATEGEKEKKVVIVGTGQRGKNVANMILRSPELDASIVGFLDFHRRGLWRYADIPLLGHPDRLKSLINDSQIDALIVAVDPEDMPRTQTLFETAEKMGITVCLLPNIFEASMAKAKPGYINGTPVVVYRAVPENQMAHAFKFAIDKIGALAGLLILSPIVAATALAIKLDNRGPILFAQERSGLNGRKFKMLKFRTMEVDAEKKKAELAERNEMSGPVFKISNDPRVTRVGKVLRKFSIDEIPQFINVLKGEMSLVGPRPPLPKEVAAYEPWQRRKLSVQPGVTCLWQVNGRNNIDFEHWMKLDLEYIDNWSLWLDTKLIARTIPAVLKSKGAS